MASGVIADSPLYANCLLSSSKLGPHGPTFFRALLWTLGPHRWEATALHEVFAPCSPKTACLSAFSVFRNPAGAILTGGGKTLKQNRKLDEMKSFETQAPGLRGSTPFEPTTAVKYNCIKCRSYFCSCLSLAISPAGPLLFATI